MPARPDRSRAQAAWPRHVASGGAHARHRGVDAWRKPGILVAVLVTAVAAPLGVVMVRMDSASALPVVVQVSSVKGAIPSAPSVVPSPAARRPSTAAAPPRLAAPKPGLAAPLVRAPIAPPHSQTGEGTWYVFIAGGCANNTLPKGTRVQVTNLASGATTTCVVNDRGAFRLPRILDMDKRVFAQLADPGTGVIPIRISW